MGETRGGNHMRTRHYAQYGVTWRKECGRLKDSVRQWKGRNGVLSLGRQQRWQGAVGSGGEKGGPKELRGELQ